MKTDFINRYIWLIDTLSKHEKLSREEINRLWIRTSLSNGEPIPERTFFHDRRAIEKIFNIDIECDRTGQYYIPKDQSLIDQGITNWMLDSFLLRNAIQESHMPSGSVEIEDVPSAREHLTNVLDAIRNSDKIVFTYAGFNRVRREKNIVLSPYFLKRYKQRWYVIGHREQGGVIRTYALDRIQELKFNGEKFSTPKDFKAADLFANIIGVTTSEAPVKIVKLQTTTTQAKYFRALPFHSSQSEEIHDDYSIFTYKLKLNYELVHEILSLGDAVKVIAPPELKLMVINQLKDTLSLYDPKFKS